ncbi:hypothetical protein VE03_10732, partial [Pseudogymnoascus sp. 23342-1-I1]
MEGLLESSAIQPPQHHEVVFVVLILPTFYNPTTLLAQLATIFTEGRNQNAVECSDRGLVFKTDFNTFERLVTTPAWRLV